MAQYDWRVLGTKVKQYAAGTTAQAIWTDITAKANNVAVDPPAGDIRRLLYLSGKWRSVMAAANGFRNGSDTTAAASSCQTLHDQVNTDGLIPLSDQVMVSSMTDDLNNMVNAGIIAARDKNAILSKGVIKLSWADQNEWIGVSVDQVAYAMSPAIQNDPILFPPG